jgi:hypothetical protein
MQRGGKVGQFGITQSPRIGSLAAVCLALLLAGCGKKETTGPAAAPDAHIRRSTSVELEKCAEEGAATYDADGDGKAEVRVATKSGREVCRVADLDSDGKSDRTTFFDAEGRVRRVESDFDRDGKVDEVSLLEAGVLREKHRATTLSGKLDTWEFYKDGRLEHSERDKNGDGIIDQWWEYPSASCPLIHTDGDGDGRPDPATTIDYCKATGYVPPDEVKARQPTESRDFEPTAPANEIREISNVKEREPAPATPSPQGDAK